MMPYLGHVFPVCYESLVDGVLEKENSFFGLGLITDIGLFLIHADHDGGHFWLAYEGAELSSRSLLSG